VAVFSPEEWSSTRYWVAGCASTAALWSRTRSFLTTVTSEAARESEGLSWTQIPVCPLILRSVTTSSAIVNAIRLASPGLSLWKAAGGAKPTVRNRRRSFCGCHSRRCASRKFGHPFLGQRTSAIDGQGDPHSTFQPFVLKHVIGHSDCGADVVSNRISSQASKIRPPCQRPCLPTLRHRQRAGRKVWNRPYAADPGRSPEVRFEPRSGRPDSAVVQVNSAILRPRPRSSRGSSASA